MRPRNGCRPLKSSPTCRQAVSLWRTPGRAWRMVQARPFIHSKRTSSWRPTATIKPARPANHQPRKISKINNRENSQAASNPRARRVGHMSSMSRLAVKAIKTIWTRARVRSNRARKALASNRVRVAARVAARVPARVPAQAQVQLQIHVAARQNSMRKQAVKATRMMTSPN
jgi:hypothetical protein